MRRAGQAIEKELLKLQASKKISLQLGTQEIRSVLESRIKVNQKYQGHCKPRTSQQLTNQVVHVYGN